jgi:hypothetical protein
VRELTSLESLTYADRVIEVVRRATEHADSELTNDTDHVLTTVAPVETLTWSPGLTWARPLPGEDGSIRMLVARDLPGIRGYYDSIHEVMANVGWITRTQVGSDWWMLIDSSWTGRNPATGDELEADAVALLFVDGAEGICGEVGWARMFDPPQGFGDDDRAALFDEYLSGLRAADAAAVTACFSERSSSAVRTYAGYDDEFVALEGAAALREWYDRFFGAFAVEEVALVQKLIREWVIFCELRWSLTLADGSAVRCRTAEILPLGPDGRFVSRMGSGTPLEPVA